MHSAEIGMPLPKVVHDARLAPTGERALHIALVMLSALGALQHGDRLTVTEDIGDLPGKPGLFDHLPPLTD
jgi:hypothetical protein